MAMTMDLLIAIGSSAAAGGLAGALVSRRLQQSSDDCVMHPEPLDPVIAERIDAFSRSWADGSGRPDAATIVANKLRLLAQLRARRVRRSTR